MGETISPPPLALTPHYKFKHSFFLRIVIIFRFYFALSRDMYVDFSPPLTRTDQSPLSTSSFSAFVFERSLRPHPPWRREPNHETSDQEHGPPPFSLCSNCNDPSSIFFPRIAPSKKTRPYRAHFLSKCQACSFFSSVLVALTPKVYQF